MNKIIINGMEFLYSDSRIPDKDIPAGMFRYSVRSADGDYGEPGTIEKKVLVNFEMDILSDKELDFKGKDYIPVEWWTDFV